MPRSPIEDYQLFLKTNAPQLMVIFTFRFELEGDQWTGRCVELGTATYGAERDDVRRELCELVVHALNSLEEDRERENFFARHGIEAARVPRHLVGLLESSPQPSETALPYWMPPPRHEFAVAGN